MTDADILQDPVLPVLGEEWLYRLRDYAPSERVLVRGIARDRRKSRVDIEFLDGKKAGALETVPGGRLKVPWCQAGGYNDVMANWGRLDEEKLDEVEDLAVSVVFDRLIPEHVADVNLGRVANATMVLKPGELESLIGYPPVQLADAFPSFYLDGILVLSPEATLVVAESACRRNPHPILAEIMEDEAKIRQACKRGRTVDDPDDGKSRTTSPEREYAFYLSYYKPRHELLRQWCGHRAVSVHERLTAAEAECHRLDELLARTIDALKERDSHGLAEYFEREHEADRITPYKVRPVPDRPLEIWEMPVREVRVRRRWGW